MKYYLYLIMFIVGIVLGYLLNDKFSSNAESEIRERIVRDTIIQVKENKPVVIEKAVPKIIYRTDSVFITKPFIVQFDTVYVKDTVKMLYYFPENTLSLSINKGRDTLKIPEIKIIKHKKEKWWIKPVIFISGAVSGYFLNN